MQIDQVNFDERQVNQVESDGKKFDQVDSDASMVDQVNQTDQMEGFSIKEQISSISNYCWPNG